MVGGWWEKYIFGLGKKKGVNKIKTINVAEV